MRLWSIHPKYLDTKGLVALWREALLAKNVLMNKTKGYQHHPQLIRFKNHSSPINAINNYLNEVYLESKKREYNFDVNKIGQIESIEKISITSGQIQFEKEHLLRKLKIRDKSMYRKFIAEKDITIHPLFRLVDGHIEEWEKI